MKANLNFAAFFTWRKISKQSKLHAIFVKLLLLERSKEEIKLSLLFILCQAVKKAKQNISCKFKLPTLANSAHNKFHIGCSTCSMQILSHFHLKQIFRKWGELPKDNHLIETSILLLIYFLFLLVLITLIKWLFYNF